MSRSWIAIGLLALGGETGLAQNVRTIHLTSAYVESSHEFNGTIGRLVELSDGTCLIFDVRASELRLVDWHTNTTRLVGSRGRGPGEYWQLENVFGLNGDSALVHDRSSAKLLIAKRSGAREAGRLSSVGARQHYLRGADQNGRLLRIAGFRFRWPGRTLAANGPLSAAESILVVVGGDSLARIDTVARLRGPSQRLVRTSMSIGEGRGVVPAEIANPVAGGDAVAMFPDGWIAIAYRDRYRIDWLTPAGRWVRGPGLDVREVRLDNRAKELVLSDLRASIPNLVPSLFDDWPAVLPPFVGEALVQSHDGRLLISRSRLSGNRIYDLVNRRGHREAAFELPANAELLYAGQRGLYVVVTDSDDVRRLRRYENPPGLINAR